MFVLSLRYPLPLLILWKFFEHFFVDCALKGCLLSSWNIPVPHALLEYGVNEAAIWGPQRLYAVCRCGRVMVLPVSLAVNKAMGSDEPTTNFLCWDCAFEYS